MKRFFVLLPLIALLSINASADMIGNADIEISDDWELVKEDKDDSGVCTNYYSSDEEVLVINVSDLSSYSDDMKIVGDAFVWDCESCFGKEEGFYLMYDKQYKAEGGKKIVQECVYYSGKEWQHSVVGSGNVGDYVISIVYASPSLTQNTHILECIGMIVDEIIDK